MQIPWNKKYTNYIKLQVDGDLLTSGEDHFPENIESLCLHIGNKLIMLDEFKNAGGETLSEHLLSMFPEDLSAMAKTGEEEWVRARLESRAIDLMGDL